VIEHWVLGGATLLGGLFGLAAILRNPDGLSADLDHAPDWWPFDLPSWRALVRIAPVGAAEGIVWGAWFIVNGLPDSGGVDAAETVLQVLILAATALLVSVALLNRPGVLVLPRMRGLPGALEEWRSPKAE
jgi:hypothetical protein